MQQRCYTRWVLNKKVRIKCLDLGPRSVESTLSDLSLKGAKLSTKAKLPKDTFVQLAILMTENFILNVDTWVVWHKAVDDLNHYGLYFSKISDHDKEKIYRFVYENYPKQLNEKRWGLEHSDENREVGVEDRRIFQRFSVKRTLKFLDMYSGEEGQASTLDISAKGIGLALDRELKPHSALEMWLEISNQQEPIYARGEVIWSKETGSGNYTSGVNLEKADLFSLAKLLR